MRTVTWVASATATVALAGCLLATAPAAAAARASVSCVTSQLQQVPGGSTSLAGSVPVLFVHGIISSSAQVWEPTTPGSIAYQAARIRGITAWTFNYEAESLDWVTNKAIGNALGASLACLANSSGHSVIVVAHSMGGLATQYALAQPDPYGGTVASRVAEVITVATPYQGSELLTAMQLSRLGVDLSLKPSGVVAEAVLAACAGHTSGICALPAVLPSQVGTDLELYSPAISELPRWPASLPVLDIAGDMGLSIGVGPLVHRFDIGDVAVTVGSATAHDTNGGPVIKYCSSVTLLGAIHGDPGPCFHTHLVNDGDVIANILAAIRGHLATPYSAYLGRWYTHDYELCVGEAPDFAAYDPTTGELPCSGSGTTGYERMWACGYQVSGCGFAWVPLSFAYRPDGTITATAAAAQVTVPSPVGGVFYDDQLTVCTLNGSGQIVSCNAGISGIPPEGVTPGSKRLSLVTDGVLKQALPQGYWGAASFDVCSTAASQADRQRYCPNG